MLKVDAGLNLTMLTDLLVTICTAKEREFYYQELPFVRSMLNKLPEVLNNFEINDVVASLTNCLQSITFDT